MNVEAGWSGRLASDVDFGYIDARTPAPRRYNPRIVLNDAESSVLRTIRDELRRCDEFVFSVAFVSARAIALLKQELVEFEGTGRIVTSDYLAFNAPTAFAELLNLNHLGIDTRIHRSKAFHPKGYVFRDDNTVTAMIGSANLTASALARNTEWNLKVSAARGSDLAAQLTQAVDQQLEESVELGQDWIDRYAQTYVARVHRPAPEIAPAVETVPPPPSPPAAPRVGEVSTEIDEPGWPFRSTAEVPPTSAGEGPVGQVPLSPAPAETADLGLQQTPSEARGRSGDNATESLFTPNAMQREALEAIAQVRDAGERRAVVISATGTGKTMLSAFDVKAVNPRRLLYLAHREQILDRSIEEYRKVIDAPARSFGKLTGTQKQPDARYLFSTIQTFSRPEITEQFAPDEFDYVIVDEAHRSGAPSYLKVLEYLEPRFMLGMTATPERTDAFNVFELFDHNVPYEIRLNQALEHDMLSPFHYYGITDVAFDDGGSATVDSDLEGLITPERVGHLIDAIETYGQAGVPPCGLIFCSRRDEAHRLSEALNQRTLRGRRLRTVALTGQDSVERREAAADQLEAGELDYILTVDIFNEGVDIPAINQVVMLRQTESAIVFVQQLGRGLRKAPGKEYLVVIDIIGNYANNYLIPIALFGDLSLNKETLRKRLIAAEEEGVLPGLSSIRFDKIAHERVLASIAQTTLASMRQLKSAVLDMQNRLGQAPQLWDFYRFDSVDPVVLATKSDHYPRLLTKMKVETTDFSEPADKQLHLLSHEVLPAKRLHELVVTQALIEQGRLVEAELPSLLTNKGVTTSSRQATSAVDTLTVTEFSKQLTTRYRHPIAHRDGRGGLELDPSFQKTLDRDEVFRAAVEDLLRTGQHLTVDRYGTGGFFEQGLQYTRKDVTRLLSWPPKWASTLYGYRTDVESGYCPIFVTLHKPADISASTQYEDALLSTTMMRWFTRNKRHTRSGEVVPIVDGSVEIHVFVQKDNADDFFYLGQADAEQSEDTTMADGETSIVRMLLRFRKPIDAALYDYFHPVLTD